MRIPAAAYPLQQTPRAGLMHGATLSYNASKGLRFPIGLSEKEKPCNKIFNQFSKFDRTCYAPSYKENEFERRRNHFIMPFEILLELVLVDGNALSEATRQPLKLR